MAIPSVFLIGPQRTGTTWLHECLAAHPQICVPTETKETYFFDKHFERGLEWYEHYFCDCQPGTVLAEAAPSYFGSAEVPARIAAVRPDAKIVATLRNPIERAWSMYLYFWSKGDLTGSFREAARQMPRILEDGLYAHHLKRFGEHFPADHILALVHEDALRDPASELVALFRFIGVREDVRPSAMLENVNATTAPRSRLATAVFTRIAREFHKRGLHRIVTFAKSLGLKKLAYRTGKKPQRSMDAATREYLVEFYRRDVEDLARMFNRDFAALWF